MKKVEKYAPSTKQTYETIEKMTPIKKILYEQEQEDQKQIETNSQQQQTIQLKASFQIPRVIFDIYFN